MSKTVWVINQYASTPATALGGRHYYMAREMAKKGYKVYIIGSASHHLLREKPVMNATFKLEEVEGFKFVWVKMPSYEHAHSKKRVLNWLLFPWRLRKLGQLIPDKPDTILCSSPSPFAFMGAQWLAKKFDARLVFEVRDIWPLTLTEIGGHSPKNPLIRLMQWVEDRAYRDSHAVVSNLKNSVEHMAARGMARKKFTWVPNGFSMDEVSLKSPLNPKAESQLPKGRFIIGYAGTLGIANALETVICAAEKLREHPDICFVLVGDGKERRALQQLVVEKEIANVFFVDSIPKVEIQAMLAQFEVCYIGLSKDPLFRFGVSPNKLFDYLYSGKPIIYGIESGSYKPVEDIGAGIQIAAENAEQLADAALKLYSMTSEERAAMGGIGHEVAIEQYEYGQLADRLSKVLFG
ncbi:glycosyltransferase family 4 protein [Marinobacter sp. BGYM27]|uniref:glycosyltransferase family 4 protein n=1 Tax=Marinobacter sp. BGYM27 TaxID=2975597 RepID=UPI0021A42F5F|nr:glycosyltransferase family 4 protein [Marinobacter sp. BGYM27]MDG5499206.1 glycosyltransferase family 4 protein [Marinobacter sp. BGYM27]